MLDCLRALFNASDTLEELTRVQKLVQDEKVKIISLDNEINTKLEELPIIITISKKELNLLTNLLSRHDFCMDYRWRGITNYRDVDFLINKLNKYGN
jgi:hypothetical protein